MEINYNDLIITRAIIHKIIEKEPGQETATTDPGNELMKLNDEVIGILLKRINDAAGKHSKAFVLDIENNAEKSFYGYCKELSDQNDVDFIASTVKIAELLAESQNRSTIPGGYLLFLDCLNDSFPVYIALKAEPHEALQLPSGNQQITLLKEVFLSPSQKLYKFGVLAATTDDLKHDSKLEIINKNYTAFLFDDQFRTESRPAEYFYKHFLGFSTDKNSKIQTQRFFNSTEQFILNNVQSEEDKLEMLDALRVEMVVNQEATITPKEFAESFFPDNGLKDRYKAVVVNELPWSTIVKDNLLVKTKLSKRKLEFSSDITLAGPNDNFMSKVKIVRSRDDISGLDFESTAYTIVKIAGKPFKNE